METIGSTAKQAQLLLGIALYKLVAPFFVRTARYTRVSLRQLGLDRAPIEAIKAIKATHFYRQQIS